jgi:hypothetical protein
MRVHLIYSVLKGPLPDRKCHTCDKVEAVVIRTEVTDGTQLHSSTVHCFRCARDDQTQAEKGAMSGLYDLTVRTRH